MVFLKKDVEVAGRLYRDNPTGDFSAAVDDPRIFDFVQLIRRQSTDNWIHTFETVEDIVQSLRGQFAYIHLLYSKQLIAQQTSPAKAPVASDVAITPFPSDFSQFTDGMENVEAASLIGGLHVVHRALSAMLESRASGYAEKAKTLWVFGRHAETRGTSSHLTMSAARFKQHIGWGRAKGERVFEQMEEFGVLGQYDLADGGDGRREVVALWFTKDINGEATAALTKYATTLNERYGQDDGLERFRCADMRIFSASPIEGTGRQREVSSGPSALPKNSTGVKPPTDTFDNEAREVREALAALPSVVWFGLYCWARKESAWVKDVDRNELFEANRRGFAEINEGDNTFDPSDRSPSVRRAKEKLNKLRKCLSSLSDAFLVKYEQANGIAPNLGIWAFWTRELVEAPADVDANEGVNSLDIDGLAYAFKNVREGHPLGRWEVTRVSDGENICVLSEYPAGYDVRPKTPGNESLASQLLREAIARRMLPERP